MAHRRVWRSHFARDSLIVAVPVSISGRPATSHGSPTAWLSEHGTALWRGDADVLQISLDRDRGGMGPPFGPRSESGDPLVPERSDTSHLISARHSSTTMQQHSVLPRPLLTMPPRRAPPPPPPEGAFKRMLRALGAVLPIPTKVSSSRQRLKAPGEHQASKLCLAPLCHSECCAAPYGSNPGAQPKWLLQGRGGEGALCGTDRRF